MKLFSKCLALCVLCLATAALSFGQETAPNPYKDVLDRLDALTSIPIPDWRYHTDIARPEVTSLDASGWETVKVGEEWKTGARVLRHTVTLPRAIGGYALTGARVQLNLVVYNDDPATITVFSNGSMVSRTDGDALQPITLTESAEPGQKFVIAVRIQAIETPVQIHASSLLITPPPGRPDPAILRDEILSAQPLIAAFPEGRQDHEAILAAAVKSIDFATLDHGDQNAFDESLRQAQTKLGALNPWMKQFVIRADGNSHIDMAWLWPWTETVEVVRNTFRSALDLMREYPDFKFSMSSARTYVWMEEKYPNLFKEIQQRVKEGRWEIVGGMWVEPDLNMPGGESLVRQILIGKTYFRKKFGVDVKIGWNPDSFGYSWQLPQIYKKSGIDMFVTQKLIWAHEFTTFPYKLFWWEAPDGSRLLTYFPHNYASGIEPVEMAKDVSVWLPSIYGTNPPPGSEMLHLYGVGDHGGGPTRTMLDNATRWMQPDLVYPKLEFSTASAFFDSLQPKLSKMNVPAWRDELYFEYHRGVFTTQAETKKRIRTTEEAVLNAEKFSAFAMSYGHPYPVDDFDRAWKDLLFDDFHDIFPGSGIAVNYLDAKRNLEDVQRVAKGVLDSSLTEISDRIDTTGPGTAVVVFNPLAWSRDEMITTDVTLPAEVTGVQVVAASGDPVPTQLLDVGPANRVRVAFRATVPSLGYATYYVRPIGKLPGPKALVTASDATLENEFVKVVVDPQTGCMTSLFDKRSNTEALAPSKSDTGGPQDRVCGNLLQTFYDKPKQWDAWNIDADFEKQHWDLDHADEVKLVENSPYRAILRIKNHFQNSTFVRDIIVSAGSPRVDVKTTANWHEKHILLKVAVPVSVQADKATFEIPYGSIERPTTRNTKAEQGKFEVPGLHWADLSDAKHGLSLLNDCKYGYDAKSNVLRLSLLRSPEWPDPHADEGLHEFTYSLYPHGGTWKDALTVRQGYDLNYPLIARQTTQHTGPLPDHASMLQLEATNVVLTAVKKAEDENAWILRFYEWAGKESDVTLHSNAPVQAAEETDLMERSQQPLKTDGKNVTIHTKPFEIKTVKLRMPETAAEAAKP
jgi:alpha-mannosidase